MSTRTKFIVSIALLMFVCLFCSTTFAATQSKNNGFAVNDVPGVNERVDGDTIGLLGDANCDQRINVSDATSIQKKVASLTDFDDTQNLLADVDCNSSVNVKDATAIQKWVAGLEVNAQINHIVYVPVTTPTTTTTVAVTEPVTEPEDSFKVTYICDENNTKQTQWYKTGAEVEDLLVPEIDGYDFNYWKDDSGKRVNSIPASNTDNLTLYADVTLKEYTIYLGGTWKYENIKYNIEKQVDLPVPVEDGLTFAGWRDENSKVQEYVDSVGVRRWRIPKGTTGDIELLALWKDDRNLIVPDTRSAQERYVDSGYDESQGCYWFLYSLGELRNVVLDSEDDLKKTNHKGGYISGSLSLAETVSIEESVGKSVSKTVSHTVTNSTDWSKTDSWENSAAIGVNASIMLGAEIGPDFVKTKVEATFGASFEANASVGGDKTTGGGSEESDETSDTIENNFAYSTALSKTEDRTMEFTHDVAPGDYYFANVGTVDVYAFVVYDPVKNTLGLETFSVLDEKTATAVLSDKKENREYVSDELSYDIDVDGIKNILTGNYFIQYNANNGITDEKGKTQNIVKIYPVNTDVQIANNPFEYTGYTFDSWITADGTEYKVADTVKNLAEPVKLVKLNAQWDANTYYISYDSNKPDNASADVQSSSDEVVCKYDTDVTLSTTPTLTGWTFGGWYLDAECIQKIGDADEILTKANFTSEPNATVTLYAKWTANSYTVTYDANEGEGIMEQTTHIYDVADILAGNCFTRTNYIFLGWSTDKNAIKAMYGDKESVSNLAESGNVTLYAVWVKTTATQAYPGYDSRVYIGRGGSHTDAVLTGMSKEALIANGYKQVKIDIVFDASRNNWIQHNLARLQIITNVGELSRMDWHTSAFADNSWTRGVQFTVAINVENLNDDGAFNMVWSTIANGGSDDDAWYLGTTNVTVTAIK